MFLATHLRHSSTGTKGHPFQSFTSRLSVGAQIQITKFLYTRFTPLCSSILGLLQLHYKAACLTHVRYMGNISNNNNNKDQLPLAHAMQAVQANSLLTSPLHRGIQVHAPAALPPYVTEQEVGCAPESVRTFQSNISVAKN